MSVAVHVAMESVHRGWSSAGDGEGMWSPITEDEGAEANLVEMVELSSVGMVEVNLGETVDYFASLPSISLQVLLSLHWNYK